ncbi:MAG: hypothetical protein K0Q43_1740 [Ramlibacter sp.]|jgi:hypothetical protein|nr:hypothetical protein [Ramlibacter sp.]
MPSPAPPLRENLFQECLDMAIGESAAMASRAMAEAGKSLAQAATASQDVSDRARLSEAASALKRRGQTAIDAFPALLREEIAAAPGAAAPSPKVISFEALELMAEDQVDDTVDLIRGQQIVMSAVEPDLVQLNALASAAQGLHLVKASSNPLRPEVWVRALHRALGRCAADPATRASWMPHISSALGCEVAALYRRLSQHMMQHGASPAAYRIVPPPPEARRRVDGAPQGPTLRDLKRLLVGVSREAGASQNLTQPAGQTMNGMTMPAAMEALQDMQQMGDVVRRMQERWRQGVWQAEPAKPGEQGATGTFTPTQTLAREVARQMIANVAADARLLPDVQDVVRELEPALLRLVMLDQRFFVERTHPARELLEEVTQRSLGWPSPDTPGFAEFLAPLRDAVQMLSQMPLEDAEPFAYALAVLRQTWADSEKRKRQQRASMARALLKADARNHAASDLATRLRERPDVASAPAHIQRFLLGPWCHVMAANADGPAPQGYASYGDMVNDIVWSAQPRLAAQNPARLERIGAPLLQAMRSGLAGIGYPASETQQFVDGLASAHTRALGGAMLDDAPSAVKSDTGVDWQQESVAWLAPHEMADSRLMQAGESVPATEFQATRPEPSAQQHTHAAPPPVDSLQPGHYVEVLVRGSWSRWRLTWASPHGSMLMFTDAQGQPESMTRQMLEKMVELGAVRLLPSASVVDGALDAVALAALETSARLPG